ncbi:hypothetical protein [Ralstonia pickettii]|uniref:hypothetical protein n=1 Tax=Ralstonia pickettii TaxID=329 RepID=UPI002175C968|nr:hypothetical protein [Ralstonia pickettii]
MKTEAYVERGKWVTDHIGPINAVMTIFTAVLIPALDFLRPYFPYIGYVAVLAVLVFFALLIMKLVGVPRGAQLHSSMVLCSGVCAAAFSVGAIASARHAEQGGLVAANFPWAAEIQKSLVAMNTTLTDIKNGKSEDPRVELKNIGVEWNFSKFWEASKTGDLRVVELFLQGEMPVTRKNSTDIASLPFAVVRENFPKAKEQLKLFQKHGVDLNDPVLSSIIYRPALTSPPPNLYALAKDTGNEALAAYLVELGVKTDSYPTWKKAQDDKQRQIDRYAEKNTECFRKKQKDNLILSLKGPEPFVDYCSD